MKIFLQRKKVLKFSKKVVGKTDVIQSKALQSMNLCW